MTVCTDLKVSFHPNITLLAKSFEGSSEGCAGLQFHLQCTWQAAKLILAQTAMAQLKSLGLNLDVYRERFERLVLLCSPPRFTISERQIPIFRKWCEGEEKGTPKPFDMNGCRIFCFVRRRWANG